MITVNQDNISKILLETLDSKKQKNSQYSMRTFASHLGVNSGILSQILKGKRRISKKQALKFIDSLDLTEDQKDGILEPFLIEERIKEAQEKERTLFDHQKFSPSELWKVYAILNLVKTDNFKLAIDIIAKRLGLMKEETSDLMTKIFAQKLLIFTEKGKLIRSSHSLRTIDNQKNESLQQGHQINCELASQALKETKISERDFTSVTLPMNPQKMEEARGIIRNFQKELCILLESGTCTEVYKLNVQLYPLSRKPE